MLRHFAHVLEQVAIDPTVSLSQLELLDESERTLVLETWNQTDAAYPVDQAISQLVEAQVARTPDALAVTDEKGSLTYAALNARANRLAHFLRALGVGPEVRVGICVPRSVEMMVAMLAVLKASGTYVPLDVSYPAERLAFMVADSGMTVLLTEEAVRAWLAVPTGSVTVSVDRRRREIDEAPATNLEDLADPRTAAYVIYTSGSEGKPKGVVCEHRGLRNLSAWHARSFEARRRWTEPQRIFAGYVGALMGAVELSSGRILVPFAYGDLDRGWSKPRRAVGSVCCWRRQPCVSYRADESRKLV